MAGLATMSMGLDRKQYLVSMHPTKPTSVMPFDTAQVFSRGTGAVTKPTVSVGPTSRLLNETPQVFSVSLQDINCSMRRAYPGYSAGTNLTRVEDSSCLRNSNRLLWYCSCSLVNLDPSSLTTAGNARVTELVALRVRSACVTTKSSNRTMVYFYSFPQRLRPRSREPSEPPTMRTCRDR